MDEVTVVNNQNPPINVEITSYKNEVDINFIQSIESVLAVHNCGNDAHANLFALKVDKLNGKGLSTNDFTDDCKNELTTTYAQAHTHINKTLLDNTTASFTTTYASQITSTVNSVNTSSNYNLSNLSSLGEAKNSSILIGICPTASSTAEKAVTLNSTVASTLTTGMNIQVIFTNANTSTTPTLNVNSTGAKSIVSENFSICCSTNPFYVPANTIVEFMYNGTYWVYKNRIVTSYVNGTSWYEQYSNGKIRQGGKYTTSSDNDSIVALLKAFLYPNYFVVSNTIDSRTGTPMYPNEQDCWNLTTTTFTVSQAYSYPRIWMAEGY